MQKKGRWLISVIVLMVGAHLQAQVYSSHDVKFTSGFMECYNREQYSRIYEDYFSEQLKASLPVDKAIEFFKTLRKDSGHMTRMDPWGFKSAVALQTAVWPLTFERGRRTMQVITQAFKVTDLVIGPYVIETPKPATIREVKP